MFNKPNELAIMAGLFGIIIIFVGLFMGEIISMKGTQEETITSYITIITNGMNGTTESITGTSLSVQSGVLSGNASASTTTSEESLALDAWDSFKQLGNTYNVVRMSMSETSALFGIPTIFYVIISSMILITFVVVLWTWFKGGVA